MKPFLAILIISVFIIPFHVSGEEDRSLGLRKQTLYIDDHPDNKKPIELRLEPESHFVAIHCQNVVETTPGCVIKDIAPRPVGTTLTIQCIAPNAKGLTQACKIGPVPGSRIQMLDFFYMAHLGSITLLFNEGKWAEISRANVSPNY